MPGRAFTVPWPHAETARARTCPVLPRSGLWHLDHRLCRPRCLLRAIAPLCNAPGLARYARRQTPSAPEELARGQHSPHQTSQVRQATTDHSGSGPRGLITPRVDPMDRIPGNIPATMAAYATRNRHLDEYQTLPEHLRVILGGDMDAKLRLLRHVGRVEQVPAAPTREDELADLRGQP